MKNIFLISFLLIFLFSCSPKLKKNLSISEADNPTFFLENASYLPEWMEGRCQLQVESGKTSLSGQAIIRMKKDSAIWVSVRKLGFEVGRALVLKDSFFYVDRINNSFQALPISYLNEKYKLPGNFFYLQALILGNAPKESISHFKYLKKEDSVGYLQQPYGNGLLSLVWDFNNKRISSLDWLQSTENKFFKMNLLDYKELESKRQFSYFRDLNIQSAETGNLHVNLSFNQVQFDLPVSLRFETPQRYSGGN